MTEEDERALRLRLRDLVSIAGEATTAATILLLTDRLVGVLDGILSRLRSIEENLENTGADS